MKALSTNKPQTLGFIDIGTNSVRLMVARVHPDHTWATITLQKESVRLGEGEFGETSCLQPAAMVRTVFICRTFVELARAHGAEALIAVATAATREASNRATFLRRLRDEAGLDVHVVSGKEEARLIYLGMLTTVKLVGQRALVIDIGGGSTELAVGDSCGAQATESLKAGAIRLTAEFPEAAEGPLPVDVWRMMRRRVHVESARMQRAFALQDIDVAFGTSGTIRNLAALAARLPNGHGGTPDILTRRDLRRVAKLLRSVDLWSRRQLAGLNPERADIIVAGAAILDAVMTDLDLQEIRALPECGLREGLVLDYLSRLNVSSAIGSQSVRGRSVLQLMRSAAADEAHARHVASLATELFDSAGEASLHTLGSAERELLSYGALLHDIGTFLSYSRHQAHSYYMIRHADLLGFDEREVAMLAAIALLHRKDRAETRHRAFTDLDRRSRDVVRTLSAYLRIAEYLDRSHTGAVAHVTLSRASDASLVLNVTPAKDWHLERWRVQDRQAALEDTLRHPLTVRDTSTTHALQEGA